MKHRYTVTNLDVPGESVTVYWRLGLLASAIASVLAWCSTAAIALVPSLVLVPVSTAVVYVALAKWTSSHLWRWSLSRALLGVTTPQISGVWHAMVTKSRESRVSSDTGTMLIEQTWRTMGVTVDTALAISHSTSSALIVDGGKIRLEYQYMAERKQDPGSALHAHRGAVFVDFPSSGHDSASNLKLNYFTEHGETGVIALVRIGAA